MAHNTYLFGFFFRLIFGRRLVRHPVAAGLKNLENRAFMSFFYVVFAECRNSDIKRPFGAQGSQTPVERGFGAVEHFKRGFEAGKSGRGSQTRPERWAWLRAWPRGVLDVLNALGLLQRVGGGRDSPNPAPKVSDGMDFFF